MNQPARVCGVANPGGTPCTKTKGHPDNHDLDAYGPSARDEAELLPCPLAHPVKLGVIAKSSGWITETANIGGGYARCLDCGLQIDARNYRDNNNNLVKVGRAEAVKLWNTRATLPTPVEPKWQPIETAPREQGILGGWYYNKEMWCWGRCEYDHGWYSISGGTPTHWMPLPAPPEAAATEGKK